MNRLAPLLAFVLFACGVPAEEAPPPELRSAGGARLAREVVLSFNPDGSVSASGPLVQGGTVRVAYATDRLPGCRGDRNGQPAWSITGFFQIDGGPVGHFEAGGFSPSGGTEPPVFALSSSAREVAIWFQLTNVWGCNAWDSNGGTNHRFAVEGDPVLDFRRDWTTQVTGRPGATSALIVSYALERLPRCRATYSGAATWDIVAFARFDDGTETEKSVTLARGSERAPAPAAFEVPRRAHSVELWFRNTDRGGCVDFDSQFGTNYRYSLD